MKFVCACSLYTAKGKAAEERRSSATDDGAAKATSSKKEKKKKKEGGKGGKGDGGPPPESMQPPPGPLVALGRPKDRANKRPRSVEDAVILQLILRLDHFCPLFVFPNENECWVVHVGS